MPRLSKAGVADASSVEDEVLREAALACPTGAIRGSACSSAVSGCSEEL
jgi:hypothetical protein